MSSATKRSRVLSETSSNQETKMDTVSFPKYEIVEVDKSKEECRPVLRMFNADATKQLELGYVNPKSYVMFARYEGKVYVGINHYNPGLFDANGDCIEKHAMGISMQSLITLFASNVSSSVLKTSPREEWNAGFKLLEIPEGHTDALRFHVLFTSPYAEMQSSTFQGEFIMHALHDV